ncbi:TetR/AcrR family transcriptional regulator [Streptomyces cinereospinus]|uniref:TetR/AcrR family transcriptional regulator n=1 Tax=Streptomyces cinereospinus TaxID=285561 RepID=A0ABV5NAC2_9ACTN
MSSSRPLPDAAAQTAGAHAPDAAPPPATQTGATASSAVKGTRRRGEKLTQAVYLATLEELALTSFEELAFDKIAARAATGKSALYRRWSTPKELVLAALTDPVVGFGCPVAPDTGTLRGDLTELLGALARDLDRPRGRALRPLMGQRPRHPELHGEIRRLVVEPYQRILLGVLRKAADRGEADPRCVTPRVASVGPRLVIAESMDRGTVGPADVDGIVGEVLLPMTAPRT